MPSDSIILDDFDSPIPDRPLSHADQALLDLLRLVQSRLSSWESARMLYDLGGFPEKGDTPTPVSAREEGHDPATWRSLSEARSRGLIRPVLSPYGSHFELTFAGQIRVQSLARRTSR